MTSLKDLCTCIPKSLYLLEIPHWIILTSLQNRVHVQELLVLESREKIGDITGIVEGEMI